MFNVLTFTALEVIGDQEKVLQDTRDVFDRTTAYYTVDKQQVHTIYWPLNQYAPPTFPTYDVYSHYNIPTLSYTNQQFPFNI